MLSRQRITCIETSLFCADDISSRQLRHLSNQVRPSHSISREEQKKKRAFLLPVTEPGSHQGWTRKYCHVSCLHQNSLVLLFVDINASEKLPTLMNGIVLRPLCMWIYALALHIQRHVYLHTLGHFLCTKFFAGHSLLRCPINPPGRYYYQRGNRTGEVKYHAPGDRAKIHIQVGQPPNLVLSVFQKLAYKIPFCSWLRLS